MARNKRIRKRDRIKKAFAIGDVSDVSLYTRAILAAVLFIFGFTYSYNSFFRDNPLYGVNFLAEALISITSALVGFYILPDAFLRIKNWLENIIVDTVTDIVSNFWEEQTKRINTRKRQKQQQKAKEQKEKLDKEKANSIVVDTSVLVDGRILEIVKTGFLDKYLVIPPAVANELHLISDNDNKQKRERGRRGLDVLKKLKKEFKVISPSVKSKENGVDKILLKYCKDNKLPLMTLDFNLNKLAKASGVQVLNINDLVEAVKLSVLPGETLEVEIVQEGKEKKQGVGYMPDGTMIIVSEAKDKVGEVLQVKVKRIIQSSAGKIIFSDII